MSTKVESVASTDFEYVTFSVNEQIFCLEITQIREIRRWSPVTVLPHAPENVLGVMNLRGAVIPIYDLAVCFGIGSTCASERNVVIVTSLDNQLVGLLAASVSEIISVRDDQIQSPPSFEGSVGTAAIQGIIEWNGEMIRIVDLPCLISATGQGE